MVDISNRIELFLHGSVWRRDNTRPAIKMDARAFIPGRAQQDAHRHGERDGSHGMGNAAQWRELQDRLTMYQR